MANEEYKEKGDQEWEGAQAERKRQSLLGDSFLAHSADIAEGNGAEISISYGEYLLEVGQGTIGDLYQMLGTKHQELRISKLQKKSKTKSSSAKKSARVRMTKEDKEDGKSNATPIIAQ